MKDKRQKMTLSWPCGDPVLAAYVLQAAAASGQLPYPGIFAAAAAASSPFGLLPPRPPPPPHPFAPTAAFHDCNSERVAVVEHYARSSFKTFKKLRVCWVTLGGCESVESLH